jgi:CRP-like cAMP-binding protein
LSAESLFLNARVHRSAAPGEEIYRDGEEGTHMYGIISGAVELRKSTTVVASLGPNDVFGERALIDHHPRNLTAVAVAETSLAEIDRKLFLFLVHESATFALGIMGALSSRLRDYDELFAATRQAESPSE